MGEKVILGLGNNIDYEIQWDKAVLEEQIRAFGLRRADIREPEYIRDPKDLLISILSFIVNGTGGERRCENLNVLLEFSRFFAKKVTMGGTSVRAAEVMRKLGYSSFIHLVTINEEIKGLLPPGCSWICSNREESCYPHLIVQYPEGAGITAGDISIRARRSNRIIYVNDPDNENMKLNAQLADHLKDSKVFLVSGFNAVKEEAVLKKRLEELESILEKLPEESTVFYEDACFHKEGFNRLVRDRLKNRIHIYSLNEDELQSNLQRDVSLLDPRQVYSAVLEIQQQWGVPYILVHSRHWALMVGKGAARFREALRGGIAAATSRFRLGDDFTIEDYEKTLALSAEKEGARFCRALEGLHKSGVLCLPSLRVKDMNGTTIGLGDAFVGGLLPALIDIKYRKNQKETL